jgi:hypothetical protein
MCSEVYEAIEPFDDLVPDEDAGNGLAKANQLARNRLHAGSAAAAPLDASLDLIRLAAGFAEMAFNLLAQLGIVLQPLGKPIEHGCRLLFHRMRVAKPFHQPIFRGGHLSFY